MPNSADTLAQKLGLSFDGLPWSQSGWRWLWLTVLLFVIDQVTKNLAESYIAPGQPIEIMPFFNLVIAYNTGAAFSFLANAGGWQVFFFATISIVVSTVLIIWLRKIHCRKQLLLSLSLCFILSGALGNLYDRIVLGHVIDFIDWYYQAYHFPAFNIADSAIFLGAVMMLWDSFRQPANANQHEHQKNQEQQS